MLYNNSYIEYNPIGYIYLRVIKSYIRIVYRKYYIVNYFPIVKLK